eukprot:TRINITY_DN8067_c0_g1_i1.p1 TRINITY_DN8067_c0_g1~~TRINITY_DN8067_c0_g1_i1.p1  ORF type:complete len:244 (+),score=41.01 TRINITY_DN8067_c0_g1_i1:89-820(+)
MRLSATVALVLVAGIRLVNSETCQQSHGQEPSNAPAVKTVPPMLIQAASYRRKTPDPGEDDAADPDAAKYAQIVLEAAGASWAVTQHNRLNEPMLLQFTTDTAEASNASAQSGLTQAAVKKPLPGLAAWAGAHGSLLRGIPFLVLMVCSPILCSCACCGSSDKERLHPRHMEGKKFPLCPASSQRQPAPLGFTKPTLPTLPAMRLPDRCVSAPERSKSEKAFEPWLPPASLAEHANPYDAFCS